MTDEEKKEYEKLKSLLYTGTISQYGKRKLIDMFEKQSKEIEELKLRNEALGDITIYNQKNSVSKDKIKEILGIEEKIDNEKLLSLLQTIVDENARLEDIEDRKVQIEYNNVFNKGVKSVEDKIKARIKEVQQRKENDGECELALHGFQREAKIEVLQSLLEKE